MKQYPGEGLPADADLSHSRDEVAEPFHSMRGQRMSYEPASNPDDAAVVGRFVQQARDRVTDALRARDENPDDLYDPNTSYQAGEVLGAAAYRNPAIWSSDWRKGLPEDHPSYVPEEELITRHDPRYRRAVRALARVGSQRGAGLVVTDT